MTDWEIVGQTGLRPFDLHVMGRQPFAAFFYHHQRCKVNAAHRAMLNVTAEAPLSHFEI